MSALTPADRRTIAWLRKTAREQGWASQSRPTRREPHRRYRWSRKGAEITLAHGNHLSIWVGVAHGRTYDTEYTGEASTVAEFVRALVGTGLLPGDVSVTQYRDNHDESDDDAQTCSRCGDSVHYLSSAGLCDGCEAQPSEPRMWRDGDPEPDGVEKVTDGTGWLWQRTDGNLDGRNWCYRIRETGEIWALLRWSELLADFGPLTEVADR